MHSSVLQNDKYIKFAFDNSVEVMSMGRLDEGIKKKDPRAATFETTNAAGEKVTRLVIMPSLSPQQVHVVQVLLDRFKARGNLSISRARRLVSTRSL